MTEQEWMDIYYRHYGPDNVPHFPDWPNMPHADWPRWGWRRWNDSEPAHEVPWDYDCCNHGESDCICVTSADADLWNSYSSLSGLLAFNPDDLSAALANADTIEDLSGFVSANSGIWLSAGYVPNIYENISALYDALNDKVDYSAMESAMSSYHVWTDSEVMAYDAGRYGDFSGTLVGIGTYERPLRVSKYIAKAVAAVEEATNNYTIPLASADSVDKLQGQITQLNGKINRAFSGIQVNHDNIKMLANLSAKFKDEYHPPMYNYKVSLEESRSTPDNIYYWSEANEGV